MYYGCLERENREHRSAQHIHTRKILISLCVATRRESVIKEQRALPDRIHSVLGDVLRVSSATARPPGEYVRIAHSPFPHFTKTKYYHQRAHDMLKC